MKRNSFFVILFTLLAFCSYAQPKSKPILTKYRGTLILNDSTELKFRFDWKITGKKQQLIVRNGEEEIIVNEIKQKQDSFFVRMPVFDSEFKLKKIKENFSGVWINHSRTEKNVIPFSAKVIKEDAGPMCGFCTHADGRWDVTFSPGTKDSSKAIGIFKGNTWFESRGTFLTETGDYRYLAGRFYETRMSEKRFTLDCFDGAHAFHFDALIGEDGKIYGDFYSGAHWHEKWVAVKNENIQLRDPEKITQLKSENEKVNFTFPDLKGKNVSLSDPKFKGKVVIVQIMGSWCPNCMDETKYLAELYKNNTSKGLEVIGLAFERTSDNKKAVSNVSRLKQRFGITYELLISGKTGKKQASETFPQLNEVTAFPTTIYIDKKGKVRKIYTGFSGPGTGEAYEKFKAENEAFLKTLLSE